MRWSWRRRPRTHPGIELLLEHPEHGPLLLFNSDQLHWIGRLDGDPFYKKWHEIWEGSNGLRLKIRPVNLLDTGVDR